MAIEDGGLDWVGASADQTGLTSSRSFGLFGPADFGSASANVPNPSYRGSHRTTEDATHIIRTIGELALTLPSTVVANLEIRWCVHWISGASDVDAATPDVLETDEFDALDVLAFGVHNISADGNALIRSRDGSLRWDVASTRRVENAHDTLLLTLDFRGDTAANVDFLSRTLVRH